MNPEDEQAGRVSVEFWMKRFDAAELHLSQVQKDFLAENRALRRLLRERLPPKSWWKNGWRNGS